MPNLLISALGRDAMASDISKCGLIGVLIGEGVGTEVVPAALSLLAPLSANGGREFELRYGGAIGTASLTASGQSLTPEVAGFAQDIFDGGGALFCGPGGERFVYELRAHFDLFCKFTPLLPSPALQHCGPVEASRLAAVDIIAVRENIGGLYQGEWSLGTDNSGHAMARHSFSYREDDVDRILRVALRLAGTRRKRLCVVVKRGGVPSISQLWVDRAQQLAPSSGVQLDVLEIDNAVYQLVAAPAYFDVIVSPNMFGDVLADCGALLLGSRGMSYSGNFSSCGRAVYQTGHGSAYDIAGRNIANPLGQMLSLAMMLENSFAWSEAAIAIRAAIQDVLSSGRRTRDIGQADSSVLGTDAMAQAVRDALEQRLRTAEA